MVGYLSGARCKLFAYGPADATATPSSLAAVKSKKKIFTLVPAYPGCPGKRSLYGCSSSSGLNKPWLLQTGMKVKPLVNAD